mmetsp:Transcript_345/g.807  ORF Transcript_345/g.807 Transcript_345/m.807 type:complete len:87 (+) Transcript_345:1843-2103(+)
MNWNRTSTEATKGYIVLSTSNTRYSRGCAARVYQCPADAFLDCGTNRGYILQTYSIDAILCAIEKHAAICRRCGDLRTSYNSDIGS